MSLQLARVAAVHPHDHSVDLVMVDDGARLSGVQVLAATASTDAGTHDLPSPAVPSSGDKWSLTERTGRDMIAVVGYIGIMPVVVGFLYPQVSQMLFKDPNRRVMRHASGVYSTIDGKGNFEMAWPNGTFLRVASDPAHEDLTGKDVDGKWNVTENADEQLYVSLELGGGKAKLTIDPSGNVTLENEGNWTQRTKGSVSIEADGAVAIQSAELTHNGLNVGSTHVHGGILPGSSDTSTPH